MRGVFVNGTDTRSHCTAEESGEGFQGGDPVGLVEGVAYFNSLAEDSVVFLIEYLDEVAD